MTRERIPTYATMKAREERAKERFERREAKKLAENAKAVRVRLAQEIVRNENDYADLPDERDPEVLALVRATVRYPTAELFNVRTRTANAVLYRDKRNPNRTRPPAPKPDEKEKTTGAVFFKGYNLSTVKKAKDLMRLIDRIGPIPYELANPELARDLVVKHWAIPEVTNDGYGTNLIVCEYHRDAWDPPWYTRAGKKLGKQSPYGDA